MGHAVYPMCRRQPPAGLFSGEEDEITNQYFITSPCSPVRPAMASAGPAQYAPGWNDENEDSLSRGASVRVQQVLTKIFLWKRFAKLQLFKSRQYYSCMKILKSVGAPIALIRDTKFSVGKAIPALHVALMDFSPTNLALCHAIYIPSPHTPTNINPYPYCMTEFPIVAGIHRRYIWDVLIKKKKEKRKKILE